MTKPVTELTDDEIDAELRDAGLDPAEIRERASRARDLFEAARAGTRAADLATRSIVQLALRAQCAPRLCRYCDVQFEPATLARHLLASDTCDRCYGYQHYVRGIIAAGLFDPTHPIDPDPLEWTDYN